MNFSLMVRKSFDLDLLGGFVNRLIQVCDSRFRSEPRSRFVWFRSELLSGFVYLLIQIRTSERFHLSFDSDQNFWAVSFIFWFRSDRNFEASSWIFWFRSGLWNRFENLFSWFIIFYETVQNIEPLMQYSYKTKQKIRRPIHRHKCVARFNFFF